MGQNPTLRETQNALKEGHTSNLALVDQCLSNITDPAGEGQRAFIRFFTDEVRAAAETADRLRATGIPAPPLMGLPISVKDLFDLEDQVTTAGSVVLSRAEPAAADAPAMRRLRQAGTLFIGRTNMTEFAYSGVGLNPHYGTPAGPYDRETRRIPGGSSSGAGVSVADGMALAAVGTDTGGSVRIPAALCGITGFKPTARRVPTAGAYPLSQSFDSIGPLAASVACCVTLDQVMRGVPVRPLEPFPLAGLRIAVLQGLPLDGLDRPVTLAFQSVLSMLEQAGASLHNVHAPTVNDTDRAPRAGHLLAAEAYTIHRPHLETYLDAYDPRVATRMAAAASLKAADYIDLLAWRQALIQTTEAVLGHYDAYILPTTPTTAPPIADLEQSDTTYFSTNLTMLRNTCIVNHIDGCALSLPCHPPGTAPVGLMLGGLAMQDDKVLRIGLAVEALLERFRNA